MKTTFPATYSTLCPAALAVLLQEKYRLKNVHCQLLTRGVGDTYEVRCSGGKFILRVYRSSHRNLAQIQEEVSLLLALKEACVSISYPIADATGSTVQELSAMEGKRHAVLFSYANGQAVRAPSEVQLLALGRETARFHNTSAGTGKGSARWTFDTETTLVRPLQLMQHKFAGTEAYTWLCEQAELVKNKLEGINSSGFSTGYCHFDLLPKNYHFDGAQITIFDFDFMGHGWLVNDIMAVWQNMMLEVYAGRMTQATADENYATFLQGYRECRPINEQELEIVPYLALGFWLFYMGFHTTHDQFYMFSQPSYVNIYTGFLKHISHTYWQ